MGVYQIDSYTLGWGPSTHNELSWITSGPIYAPPTSLNSFFASGKYYTIHGAFGWESVPSKINYATMLLVRDYACSDDIYRRKGVVSINSGNWRMDFAKNAFDGTGNADVDRILGEYGNPYMAVI
jgi:hypothetical protein